MPNSHQQQQKFCASSKRGRWRSYHEEALELYTGTLLGPAASRNRSRDTCAVFLKKPLHRLVMIGPMIAQLETIQRFCQLRHVATRHVATGHRHCYRHHCGHSYDSSIRTPGCLADALQEAWLSEPAAASIYMDRSLLILFF